MSVIFDDEKPEAYHWRMDTGKRIDKLEVDDESHTATLVYLKTNCATKNDIRDIEVAFAELKGEVRAQIAEAKNSIIVWSVTAIFLAQLLPALLKLFLTG